MEMISSNQSSQNAKKKGRAKGFYHFPTPNEPSDMGVHPWIRDDYDAKREVHLCFTCSQIDFRYLFSKDTEQDLVLGTVEEIRERQCAFCTRFTKALYRSSPFMRAVQVSGEDLIVLRSRTSLF